MKSILLAFLLTPSLGLAQQAQFGEPLKDAYALGAPHTNSQLHKTDEVATGHRIICDVERATPSPNREGWYTFSPIEGLRLELLPLLVKKTKGGLMGAIVYDSVLLLDAGGDRSHGFAIIVKNDDLLVQFQPRRGDIFVTWANEGTDYVVAGGGQGGSGYATFDLMTGDGFYYKKEGSDPSYSLTHCQRTRVAGLPVYKYDIK